MPSSVPLLKGDNYRVWARKMTAYLQLKSLYQYMRPEFVEPVFTAAQQLLIDNVDMDETPLAPGVQDALDAQTAFATWKLLDDQALGAINLQLSESIAEIYDNIDNAQALWHALLQCYGTTSRTGTYYEYQSIMDWKLDECKDPEESLNAIVARFERLAGQGFTLPEEQKAMTLLRGVPRNWDSFVGSVLANVGPSGLTVQHVSIQIREEWRRRHPPSMVHTTNANMARGDLQNRIGEQAPAWRGRGGGRGPSLDEKRARACSTASPLIMLEHSLECSLLSADGILPNRRIVAFKETLAGVSTIW